MNGPDQPSALHRPYAIYVYLYIYNLQNEEKIVKDVASNCMDTNTYINTYIYIYIMYVIIYISWYFDERIFDELVHDCDRGPIFHIY